MMKLKKKIKIENATAFKLEYSLGSTELKSKEFNSYKAMEQFHNRQKAYSYLDYNRFALIDGEWRRFIKLNSPFVFQEEISFINQTFNDVVEEKNLQKYIVEK